MIQFETGKTYMTRSACDYNCIFEITVEKRTAKTITTTEGKRLRIREWEGVEQVMPMGSYSMAPVIGADKELQQKKPAFDEWLDTLIDEKGIDPEQGFEIEGEWGPNYFTYGVIIEAIKGTSKPEQQIIKTNLVKIDFCNGDIRHYFRHLAQALAI
jgi:hypothetical protein